MYGSKSILFVKTNFTAIELDDFALMQVSGNICFKGHLGIYEPLIDKIAVQKQWAVTRVFIASKRFYYR